MQKQSIISIILGVGTTLFVIMINLPPLQKPSAIQQTSGLSYIPGDIIEDNDTSNSTDDYITTGDYLNVKGSYSLSHDFEDL
jgi:hypothetical protein